MEKSPVLLDARPASAKNEASAPAFGRAPEQGEPMNSRRLVSIALMVVSCALTVSPVGAADIVEEDTGTGFPQSIALEAGGKTFDLVATGVGLREATFLKVNVYAAASYVAVGFDGGKHPAEALVAADMPKRIVMKFVRDVGADDVSKAYREGLEKNAKNEMKAFAEDLDAFLGFFSKDVKVGDTMTITYVPGIGLSATHNDRSLEAIADPGLARAVWAIWFGKKPVSKNLRRDMLSLLH